MPKTINTTEISLKSWSLYFASVIGYTGVAMMVWQFILGTRTFIGLFTDDISWANKIHSWMGKYGSLLIFAHPVLIGYSYSYSLTKYLKPSFATEFDQHVAFGRFALWILATIWITSALVRGLIRYRPWKFIHYLSYPMMVLAFLHAPEVGHSFSNPGIQFFWFSFLVVFFIAVVLRLRILFGFGVQVYKIDQQKNLADQIFMLKLSPQQKAIQAKLGQFVYIRSGLFGESHPFSIVDINPNTGDLIISYKVFGRFTKNLTKFQAGKNIYVDGSYGVFTAEVDEKLPVVFIAGGIGITPFIGHLMSRANFEKTFLFYSVRNKQQAVFSSLAGKKLGSNFVLVDTEQNQTINSEMIKNTVVNINDFEWFICGPQPMMDHVEKVLLSLGVSSKKIHFEKFSF
jgi:predicted ferric reductase